MVPDRSHGRGLQQRRVAPCAGRRTGQRTGHEAERVGPGRRPEAERHGWQRRADRLLQFPGGRLQHTAYRFPTLLRALFEGLGLYKLTSTEFAAEMLPLQRLDHANIARYYDSGTHGGLAFVACELVEGEDCARRLEAGRRPWREVLSVAVQAARALKHAHNRNVLHRDLKPAHLMLTPDGTLKVLGFGLAKVVPAPGSE